MSQEEFADTFGRPVPGRALGGRDGAYAQRPFADTAALRGAMQEALFSAPPEQQEELMSVYPDLGPTRGLRTRGRESTRDQSVLGLTGSPTRTTRTFTELTRRTGRSSVSR